MEAPDQGELDGELRDDPAAYARQVFDVEIDQQEQELFDALARYDRVAVPKGHSTGGTWTVAAYLLQQLDQHPSVKILTTGPTQVHVKRVIFGQLRDFVHRARGRRSFAEPSSDFLDMTSTGGEARWIAGLSTNDVNRFSGHKAPRLIVWLDECDGVRPEIWSATDGLTASGDAQIIVTGQPYSAGGPFFEACHGKGSRFHVLTMDCFRSANLVGWTEEDMRDAAPDDPRLSVVRHPYLVRAKWVHEQMSRLTPAEWATKVRGRFPDEDAQALFRLSWLYAARDRLVTEWDGPVRAGLDIAGPGRRLTVLTIRGGPNILFRRAYRDPDPRGLVLADLRPWREQLAMLNGDAGGIGYNFLKHLEDHRVPVRFVNFGGREDLMDPERFQNKRAEIYYGLRERFELGEIAAMPAEGGVSMLTDECIADLAALARDPSPSGKERLASKARMRVDGDHSFDDSDSLALAFMDSEAAEKRASDAMDRMLDHYEQPGRRRRISALDEDLGANPFGREGWDRM